MVVTCKRRCWCTKRGRRYYPGDTDDIDPMEPIALYFDFPPGTEVYHKTKDKKGKLIQTTRKIPGVVEPKPAKMVKCKYCDKEVKNISLHLGHCEAALAAGKVEKSETEG